MGQKLAIVVLGQGRASLPHASLQVDSAAKLAEWLRSVPDIDSVAVLGAHYEPGQEWQAAALHAQADVLCGPVRPAPTLSTWGWAYYVAEYSHLAARPAKLEARHIAAGNVVYRAKRINPDWFLPPGSEIDYHQQMIAAGLHVNWDEKLEVSLTRVPDPRSYWLERKLRSKQRLQPLLARSLPLSIAYAAASVAVVPVRLFHGGLRAATPRWPSKLLRALPLLALISFLQAAANVWCLAESLFRRPRGKL